MYTYVYVYTYISRVLGNPSVSPEIWESVGESSMSSSSSNLSFFIRWTIPLHSYLHDHDVWEKTTMSQNRPVRSQVSGPGPPDLRPDLRFSGRPDPRPYLSGVFLRPHSLTVDCVFFFLPSKKRHTNGFIDKYFAYMSVSPHKQKLTLFRSVAHPPHS